MTKANTTRKNSRSLVPVVVLGSFITVGLVGLGWLNKVDGTSISEFPTLMDASGKVNVAVGDFMPDKQPFIGQATAPVTVIEFIDYKCPACAAWSTTYMAQFKREFVDSGQVKLYTINFPFLGPDSILAAMAGEAIAAQSPEALHEFTTKLYANQGEEKTIWATQEFILDFVKKNVTGIDFNQFKSDLQARTHLFNVKEDFKIAAKNGINGTPSFVINGQQVPSDYETIKAKITAEIQAKQP